MTWLRVALLSLIPMGVAMADEAKIPNVVLVIHGGIGLDKKDLTPELEKEYRAALAEALQAGYETLQKPGAASLDAVEVSIKMLEDSPLFNAGKGAVFTNEGKNELDASVMEGKTMKAGAVAGVTTIKNPISAARAVMEKSEHVMLVGPGAEAFAKKCGLTIVDPKYFWTEKRWKQIEERRKQDAEKEKQPGQSSALPTKGHDFGTVGAVALDAAGVLAAGTSTGGMTNKRFGRVGDSPIIGAGTYADNEACGVSCTGHGEYFIRYAAAHSIVSLMKYKNLPIEQAAEIVIKETLKDAGGEGGAIALDPRGNCAMPFNTEGMYRGYVTRDGKITVLLYEQ